MFQQQQNSFTPRTNFGPSLNQYQPYSFASSQFGAGLTQDKGKGKSLEQDVFDDKAFEQAFEAHAKQEALDRSVDAEVLDRQANENLAKSREGLGASSQAESVIRDATTLESKLHTSILESKEQIIQEIPAMQDQEEQALEPENRVADDEELAATAGELLDRVSDNTSQKFRESSFLALMSKLRDREVRVEGDRFVDVNVSDTSRIAAV